MPIFQFKCENCSTIFEHLVSARARSAQASLPVRQAGLRASKVSEAKTLQHSIDANCITCGGDKISRIEDTFFSPNKLFCPRESKSGGCGKNCSSLNI